MESRDYLDDFSVWYLKEKLSTNRQKKAVSDSMFRYPRAKSAIVLWRTHQQQHSFMPDSSKEMPIPAPLAPRNCTQRLPISQRASLSPTDYLLSSKANVHLRTRMENPSCSRQEIPQ